MMRVDDVDVIWPVGKVAHDGDALFRQPLCQLPQSRAEAGDIVSEPSQFEREGVGECLRARIVGERMVHEQNLHFLSGSPCSSMVILAARLTPWMVSDATVVPRGVLPKPTLVWSAGGRRRSRPGLTSDTLRQ